MSLFGAQQPQQQAAPSLFGASQSTTQPRPLFGQPAAAAPQSTPSLFGSTTAPPATSGGGLFGQQQQQPQTGGLFGNTQSQPSGSNFFGNPQTQTQQPATGGLFGNTSAVGAKPAGSALGAVPTLPSLNTTSNALNTTGGSSLFGGSTFGQQPATQQQGASSFFAPSATAPKPLFGAPAASMTTNNNIFGTSTSAANASASKPLFGTSLLGQQPTQQQQQQNPFGTSTLTTSALRAPAATGGAATQQADAQTQFAKLTARIEEIAAAWNAMSPQCQFQYFFYNRVDPAQIGLYGRPPNATNEALWTKAVRDNPDPTTLVPAIAVGFDDLRQRVDAQGQQAVSQLERLKELKTRLEALSSTQQQNTARLSRLSASQTQLMHRLLLLAAHLHLLVPSLRSSGIRVEEEEMRGWLEEVREEVGGGGGGGGGGGRMRGKLGELWALVGAIMAQQQQAGARAGGGEWKVVDEDGLARIAQILSEQQAGLVHLTKILRGDLADINVVLRGGGAAHDGEGLDVLRSRRSVR